MIRREFTYLTSARCFLALSVGMQATIMGWQIYEITRNPIDLGLIGLFEAIPAIGLALFAESFVDRSNPLSSYRAVFWGTLLSLILVWIPSWLGHPSRWNFFLAGFVTGAARAFAAPSFARIFPRLVPIENTAKAAAWSISVNRLGSILGPALAGFLLASLGVRWSYGLNVLFLCVGIFFLSRLNPLKKEFKSLSQSISISQTMKGLFEGVHFVFGHAILLPALALDMFAVLFGGVTAILPVFAKEILHTDASGLGILRASFSFGALILSALLVRFPLRRKLGPILLTCVTGFGAATVAFAFSNSLWVAAFWMAIAGGFDSVSMVIRGAIVQFYAPDEIKGRVAAVNSIFIGSSNELGALESGLAAKWLGVLPSIFFGAAMTFASVIIALVQSKKLSRLDELK